MSATAAGAGHSQRRIRLATPGTALVLGVATIVLVLIAVVFTVAEPQAESGRRRVDRPRPGLRDRRPHRGEEAAAEPDGLVLLGCALCLALDDAASSYSVLDYRRHHGSLPLGELAVLLQPAWAPGIAFRPCRSCSSPTARSRPGGGGCRSVSSASSASSGSSAPTGSLWTHRLPPDPRRLDREPAAGGPRDRGLVVVERLPERVLPGHPADRRSWLVARVPVYRRATGVRRAQLKWLMAGVGRRSSAPSSRSGSTNGLFGVLGFVGTTASSACRCRSASGSSATGSTRSTG